MKFAAPNYTQTPNTFFDEMAKTLKEGELRVLLVIMRQTFGWRKRWDKISLSQLCEKTGMCRDAVNNAIKTLVEKGAVIKHKKGDRPNSDCWYTLVTDEPEKEEEIPDEFNEDSNNPYWSSKTTRGSRLKRPTKETDIQKKIYISPTPLEKTEEKKQRATNVSLTDRQHADILERCGKDEEVMRAVYDRLSSWKLSKPDLKEIDDYAQCVKWTIKAVVSEKKQDVVPAHKELAKKITGKFKTDDIQATLRGIEFRKKGTTYFHEILYTDNNFQMLALHQLKKMGYKTEGL